MGKKSLLITARLGADEWVLLRVSEICRVNVPAPEYVSLEPKLCESCGRQFLRPIGSEVKLCAGRHSAPVSLLDRQRLAAALVEGEEGRKAARR
jgi:hypothetical protein